MILLYMTVSDENTTYLSIHDIHDIDDIYTVSILINKQILGQCPMTLDGKIKYCENIYSSELN